MLKAYKYRIYPSKIQKSSINEQLEISRLLYNSILENRINFYKNHNQSSSLYDTQKWITGWKKEDLTLKRVYSQVLQEVATQVDSAFQGFFRRLKKGNNPGYPRFKAYGRLKTLIYKQSGYRLVGNRLKISKIGYLKIIYHRDLPGNPRRLIIKKSRTDKYYAIFLVEIEQEHLQYNENVVGVDLGINRFITLNDGSYFDNPRYLERSTKDLARLQRKHKREGTERTRVALAKRYEKVVNQRKDYYHKTTNYLIKNYQVIALEDLDIKKMIESGWRRMNRVILDAGWGTFIQILEYKAEEAGRTIVKVNPAYTSRECSNCGHTAKKNRRSQSEFKCLACEYTENADTNAAINILSRGLSTLEQVS